MNTVPFGPITMVRAPGWPCDQTSALKPAGNFNLSTGSLSAAVTVGGVGCGDSFWSCWLCAGLVTSIGLKPGGGAGAGVGWTVGGAGFWPGCCAVAAEKPNASSAAAEAASRVARFTIMGVIVAFLPW